MAMGSLCPDGWSITPLERYRGWMTVIGGVLVHLTLGTIYCYGNMAPYVVSYIRKRGPNYDISYDVAMYIFGLMYAGQGLAVFFGGLVLRNVGVRWATFLGATVFCSSLFLSYFAIKVSFYFLLFTYGLLFGIGMGLCYLPPLICIMKWTPNRKGLSTGIISSAIGAGIAVFTPIQTLLINPHNLSPDIRIEESTQSVVYYSQDSVLDRVPASFLFQGGIFFVMIMTGIILMTDPPDTKPDDASTAPDERSLIKMSLMTSKGAGEENTPANGSRESMATHEVTSPDPITSMEESSSSSTTTCQADNRGDFDPHWSGRTVETKKLYKEVFFWQVLIAMLLHCIAVVVLAAVYKVYGETFISDDFFLAAVGSVAALANAAGRTFWGFMADTFSFKVTFMIFSTILAVGFLTISLTPYGGKAMFLCWIVGMYFAFGGMFSTLPSAISRAFGSKYVGSNYGVVFFVGNGISGIATPILTQWIHLHFKMSTLFLMMGLLPSFNMVMGMFFNVKTPNGKDI